MIEEFILEDNRYLTAVANTRGTSTKNNAGGIQLQLQ
jgi:hypothetical protein